jgi:uncharacterized protein (TIGR02246 family)
MKIVRLASTLAILTLVFSAVVFAGDVEDVTATNQQLLELFNKGEFDAYAEGIHPDIEAFTGVTTPRLFKGKDAWMAFINGLKETERTTYTQVVESVRVVGNTAVINGYFDFTVFTKDGQVLSQGGRSTMVMVKEDGKWLGYTFHFSAYF